MTRRIASFLAVLSLLVPLTAGAQATQPQASSPEARFKWEPMQFRNISASAVAQELNWAKGGGLLASGFADSLVFRRGATTRTLVDTSAAYPIDKFGMPPTFNARGGAYGSRAAKFNGGAVTAQFGQVDSVIVDTTDAATWVAFRIRQDSLSVSFSGTSTLDSALIAAQVSYDGGINWLSVSGTPTRAFYATTIASAEDGLQPPVLAAAEISPGADVVPFAIQCQPSVYQAGGAVIINRTLCAQSGALVRFLVDVADGSGQFRVDLGYWDHRE